VSEPPPSLYVTADDRPWQERRPGVHWKVLWEDLVLAIITGGTESA
jgi:hypothetical protein